MKQRFFPLLIFALFLGGCAGITPAPTLPVAIPMAHPELEPINAENIHRLEQVAQFGDGIIYGIAYSPNKQMIAVHVPKGIYLYDSSSLAQIGLIEKSAPTTAIPGQYFPLAFSPDGKLLAFSNGWIVNIYDLSKNQYAEQAVFSSVPDWNVSEIAFSPDGNRILLKTGGGLRRCDGGGVNYALYDFNSHLLYDRYFCTQETKSYYRFTQDGKFYLFFASIMTYDFPLEVYVVDSQTGELLESSVYEYPEEYNPEKFFYDVSFDGNILATARYEGNNFHTFLLDATTRAKLAQADGLIEFVKSEDSIYSWRPIKAMHTQRGETDLLVEMCTNPSIPRISKAVELEKDKVVTQSDSLLEVINLSTCTVENSVHFHSSYNNTFSPNNRFLATNSYNHTVIWDLESGKSVLTISGNTFENADDVLSFNADGSLFLTGKQGGENILPDQPNRKYVISVWDVQTGKKIKELSPVTEFLDSILPTPDKRIIMVSDVAGLQFWNVQTGKLLTTIPAGISAFTEDGNQIWISVINQKANRAQGIQDIQTLTLYDYRTGRVIQKLEPTHGRMRHIYLNKNGSKIALHYQAEQANSTFDNVICIVDLASREEIWRIQWNVLTSPFEQTSKYQDWEEYGFSRQFYLWQNGEILANHGFDLYTTSWQFQSEKPYSVIPNGELLPKSEIVLVRNDFLPYSYQKEVVQFWSAKTGNLLGEIRTYYKIEDVAFSPDGYWIAVSGDDGIVRIWGVKKTIQ